MYEDRSYDFQRDEYQNRRDHSFRRTPSSRSRSPLSDRHGYQERQRPSSRYDYNYDRYDDRRSVDRYRERDRDHHNNRVVDDDMRNQRRRDDERRRDDGHNRNQSSGGATVRSIKVTKLDAKLPQVDDDPRFDKEKGVRYAKMIGGGRNTESFDPKDTLVRPDLRVIVGPNREQYGRPLKHDDVVIVPEFFCKEDDWDLYYKLVAEIRDLNEQKVPNSQFISWHEGAHLIVKDPSSSPTFQLIQEKIAKYFGIPMKSVGTRFNW